MKNVRYLVAIAICLLTMTLPSNASAQSWWEAFANTEQANSFWDWLQQYPQIAAFLEQNPYQVYDPNWRSQYPEFQQYVDNNPGWWNSIVASGPQYYGTSFNQFLSNRPQIGSDLLKNPQLIYNSAYLAKHPQLQAFLATPGSSTWQPPKKQTYAYSPRGGWGAYNDKREWRNEPWWKQNGDWDQQNKWHDSNWWKKNNRTHAEQYHPNWFINQGESKTATQQPSHGPRVSHRRAPNVAGR